MIIDLQINSINSAFFIQLESKPFKLINWININNIFYPLFILSN